MTESICEIPSLVRVLITLVLRILSQYPEFLNPLSIFSTVLQNVLNALPAELLECPLLKTDISPLIKLFVTFPVESVFGKTF